MFKYLLLIIFIAILYNFCYAFRQQNVGVRGRLMCGNETLSNTTVKLWNKNKLASDDQLGKAVTDKFGNYKIEGGVGGVLSLDVYLKIYHDCSDGLKPCQRKVALKIPKEFVTRSLIVEKWFEAGVMNMQFIYPDEERSCIN